MFSAVSPSHLGAQDINSLIAKMVTTFSRLSYGKLLRFRSISGRNICNDIKRVINGAWFTNKTRRCVINRLCLQVPRSRQKEERKSTPPVYEGPSSRERKRAFESTDNIVHVTNQ